MAADPYRALVIEDDPDLAHLTGMILENGAGMSTALACDAITALELLERDRFDVVISDIQMPGRSGLELLPEIHRLAPGVPVKASAAKPQQASGPAGEAGRAQPAGKSR